MRRAAVLLLTLAACGPSVPDSNPGFVAGPVDIGRGVGLGPGVETQAPVPEASPAPAISAEELAAAGLPSGAPTSAAEGGPAAAALPAVPEARAEVIDAAPTVPGRPPANNPGISDEQSFDAVTARRTIEDDAERLERSRANYRVAAPEPLPQRTGAEGPNIVQYALRTTNRVGEALYRRGGFFAERKYRRACAGFPSPDLAQQAFLARGGPQRDRLGVDPDGDGFACTWDPTPFREAVG